MTISSALAQSELDELTSLLRNGQLTPWDFSRAAIILAGALLMVSSFKIPKLGVSRWKMLTVFIFANVLIGYALGFARRLPEILSVQSGLWLFVSLGWGVASASVRGMRAPTIFPTRDLAPHERPQRPEDDLLPDEEDDPADGAENGDDEPAPAPR